MFPFAATAPPHIYTLSLHDALPISQTLSSPLAVRKAEKEIAEFRRFQTLTQELVEVNQKICRWRSLAAEKSDRKSTRLNSSHVSISYAVFCLKKKTSSTMR